MEGTGIEMLALVPYLIELISLIPLGAYIIFQIVTGKYKYINKLRLSLVILYSSSINI